MWILPLVMLPIVLTTAAGVGGVLLVLFILPDAGKALGYVGVFCAVSTASIWKKYFEYLGLKMSGPGWRKK